MSDESNGDRIQRDAAEIARAAADIVRQRDIEAGDEAKERDIDAQIAKLQHDRADVDAERVAAHEHEIADEKVIADRDRDLREALGGSPGGPGGSPGGPGGNPGGPGGNPGGPGGNPGGPGGNPGGPGGNPGDTSPAPGPGGPPVVPPRRVG